jgi:hypothetical protein
MVNDLDDILVSVDCPRCGTTLSFPYRQARLQKAAGCICGALIKIDDDTQISSMQALIDEASSIEASNE